MPRDPNSPLTVAEAAAELRVTTQAVYQRLRSGNLARVVVDGRTMIPRDAVAQARRGARSTARRDRGAKATNPARPMIVPEAKPVPTLAEAAARWLATQVADTDNKRRHVEWLERLWGPDTPIDRIDHEQRSGLAACLAQPIGATAQPRSVQRRAVPSGKRQLKGKGLSAATIKPICQTAQRIFEFGAELGWCRAAKIPRPRVPIPDAAWCTEEELRRLFAVSGDSLLVYMLASRAGLRRGEIDELRWGDIDLRGRRIRVSRAYKPRKGEWVVASTKGFLARTVPIPPDLVEILSTRIGARGDLVVHDCGERVPLWRLSATVPGHAIAAGFGRPFTLHSLRHTYCSHLAQQGCPAIVIQKLAGHSSLQTTQRYLHVGASQLDEAVRYLPPIDLLGLNLARPEASTRAPASNCGAAAAGADDPLQPAAQWDPTDAGEDTCDSD